MYIYLIHVKYQLFIAIRKLILRTSQFDYDDEDVYSQYNATIRHALLHDGAIYGTFDKKWNHRYKCASKKICDTFSATQFIIQRKINSMQKKGVTEQQLIRCCQERIIELYRTLLLDICYCCSIFCVFQISKWLKSIQHITSNKRAVRALTWFVMYRWI